MGKGVCTEVQHRALAAVQKQIIHRHCLKAWQIRTNQFSVQMLFHPGIKGFQFTLKKFHSFQKNHTDLDFFLQMSLYF